MGADKSYKLTGFLLFPFLHSVTSLVSLTKSSANLTSKQSICLKEVIDWGEIVSICE